MPNYYLEQVLPLGVLTGSRAFNCATESSDWDIVIHESLLPDWKEAYDYQNFEFHNGEDIPINTPELEDEPRDSSDDNLLQYDAITIWGPITQIIKYWYLADPDDESTEVCINLFVYPDRLTDIYQRFNQLNKLMNICYGASLQNKQVRIEAFTKVIKLVGITDL